MGKSKYQIKAQNKVVSNTNPSKKKPQYYDEKINIKKGGISKPFFIAIIAIVIIGFGTGFGLLIANDRNPIFSGGGGGGSSTTDELVVANGLNINFEYTLWTAEPGSGPSGVVDTEGTPYQGPAEFPVENFDDQSVIYGFYKGVLGMKVGEEKTFSCAACIDDNKDGYDDNTGLRCESYGYNTEYSQLRNTNLIFKVKVLSIEQ